MRNNKTAERACTGQQQEVTRRLHKKEQGRKKPDENGVMAELTIINP